MLNCVILLLFYTCHSSSWMTSAYQDLKIVEYRRAKTQFQKKLPKDIESNPKNVFMHMLSLRLQLIM